MKTMHLTIKCGRVCLFTMHVLSLRLKQQYLSALPYFKLTLLANGADVCYVKLKKRRYLDKCRLSAPAGISDRDKLTLVTTDRPFSYGVNAAHLTIITTGTYFASHRVLAHFKVNFFSRSNFPFSLVFVFLQLQPLGFPFIAVIEAI